MLSIIIPTLNEEKYLPRLLECILSQDLKDYEIIVSDGNSKDNTIAIAKKYNCKIALSRKQSPAHQRNEGAKLARGDLLLFLDADSYLPKDFIKLVLEEFKKRNLDIAGFYFKFNSKKTSYQIASLFFQVSSYILNEFHPVSIGAAILVKKDYHYKVHGFDESIFVIDDHVYSKRIKNIGGKYGIIRSRKVLFSVRRFEKEGLIKVGLKWFYMASYYTIRGPCKKKIISYDFGL